MIPVHKLFLNQKCWIGHYVYKSPFQILHDSPFLLSLCALIFLADKCRVDTVCLQTAQTISVFFQILNNDSFSTSLHCAFFLDNKCWIVVMFTRRTNCKVCPSTFKRPITHCQTAVCSLLTNVTASKGVLFNYFALSFFVNFNKIR